MAKMKANSEHVLHPRRCQYEYLPLTLSIETLGGIATSLVLRGTPLPVQRSRVFSTASDNQKSVGVKALWGESPLARKNILIGEFTLADIPEAPRGTPQIRVTFEIDKFCQIKAKATELESGKEIAATLEASSTVLTSTLIAKILKRTAENKTEDTTLAMIAEAELVVRKDQEGNITTATTAKIERLIGEAGTALSNKDEIAIRVKTQELEKALNERKQKTSTSPFGGWGDFLGFGPYAGLRKSEHTMPSQASSGTKESQKSSGLKPIVIVPEGTLVLLQSYLEAVDPTLEEKRSGAWEALGSGRPDGCAQAAYSMREVLRLFLDKLASEQEVKKAPWYKKPDSGTSVTRAMRIRYIVLGSGVESESTLSLIDDLAQAVESMYAKLSAESHSDRKAKITATRWYLNACEAVIGLIASVKTGSR